MPYINIHQLLIRTLYLTIPRVYHIKFPFYKYKNVEKE